MSDGVVALRMSATSDLPLRYVTLRTCCLYIRYKAELSSRSLLQSPQATSHLMDNHTASSRSTDDTHGS